MIQSLAGTPLRLAALAGVGGAIELTLLLGWLRPLSLRRWPTNLPAGAQIVPMLGDSRDGALRFLLPTLLLILLWCAALLLAHRLPDGAAVWIGLAFATLFLATLLPMNPAGTQDIYHNVADGRLFWLHGVNPTLVPPIAFPEDPFTRHVWGYDALPSAYGPLWYLLTGIPTALAGDGLVANLVAQKALVAAFMLATVLVTAMAARTLVPGRATLATVLIGWSPLLLWESAGNGHNDAVMAFFLAGALLAAARNALRWVLPLLALSALVKFTTALAIPVALVWLWRQPGLPRRSLILSGALALALALLLYAPMWAGADTVAALRRPGMTFILSPATLLHGALAGPLGDAGASRLVRLATGATFLVVYAVLTLRVRGDARCLVATIFDVTFLYLLLASWWFFPWYLTWLAPAAALARGPWRWAAFGAATSAALLTYLYWWPDPAWRSREWFVLYGLIAAGVFAAPCALWLAGLARSRRRTALSAQTLPARPLT